MVSFGHTKTTKMRKRTKRQRIRIGMEIPEIQRFGQKVVGMICDSTGLTSEELAFHCGVSSSTVGRWRKNPRTMTINNMISFVDVVNRVQPRLKIRYDDVFQSIILAE
jgi:hypothetical protein